MAVVPYNRGFAAPGLLWIEHRASIATSGPGFTNYGAGNPTEAAAWVKIAKTNTGDAVGLWEVGNENHGCFETNDELAEAPANYKNFKVGEDSTCPMTAEGTAKGMQLTANSYAVHAARFMSAMKAVSPSAQIGVPWVFDETVSGAAADQADLAQGRGIADPWWCGLRSRIPASRVRRAMARAWFRLGRTCRGRGRCAGLCSAR
jgi:hypothetical protein